jgi:flagellar biosynthesis/type III secretory pathway M-ring protein FliF/YscJ
LALLLLAWFVLRPMATRLTTPQANANPDREDFDLSSHPALAAPPALTAMPGASAAHLESQNLAKSLASEDPNLTARILHQWTQQS